MLELRNLVAGTAIFAAATAPSAFAQSAKSPDAKSIERGRYVVKIGGCNDCHTAGYVQAGGKVPEKEWLTGDQLGWRGPWGTTYAINLRLYALRSEQRFVAAMKKLKTRPPMPWYNVRAMDESDLQSLYQYIKSLGDVGKQAPFFRNPGEELTTPYIQLAPPQMPKN